MNQNEINKKNQKGRKPAGGKDSRSPLLKGDSHSPLLKGDKGGCQKKEDPATCNTPIGATFCSPGYLATEPKICRVGDGYVNMGFFRQPVGFDQSLLEDMVSLVLSKLRLALNMISDEEIDDHWFVIESVLDDVERRLDEIIDAINRDVGEVILDVATELQETPIMSSKKIRHGRVLRAYLEESAE